MELYEIQDSHVLNGRAKNMSHIMKDMISTLLLLLVIAFFFDLHKQITVSDLLGTWLCSEEDIYGVQYNTDLELRNNGSFTKTVYKDKTLVLSKAGKYYFSKGGASRLDLDFGNFVDSVEVSNSTSFDYPTDVLCTKNSK